MTKRIFSIEWPDDLGQMWMNKDNLLLCLNAYCENTDFVIEDVTDEITSLKELAEEAIDEREKFVRLEALPIERVYERLGDCEETVSIDTAWFIIGLLTGATAALCGCWYAIAGCSC